MRIGHASISENNNNGRDGRAKAGDQTGKEVCIRSFYSKPWKTLLRCKDSVKAEIMAKACEAICNNPNIGYDQSQRVTLNSYLAKNGYDYNNIKTAVECDCSSFMTACAECAGIFPHYTGTNPPVTANMVERFKATGYFDVITDSAYINNQNNLKRGDILVGPPNTHTVMVLDNGTASVKNMPVLRKGAKGNDVLIMQAKLKTKGYNLDADGIFGPDTLAKLKQFQKDHCLVVDGICGPATWKELDC